MFWRKSCYNACEGVVLAEAQLLGALHVVLLCVSKVKNIFCNLMRVWTSSKRSPPVQHSKENAISHHCDGIFFTSMSA
jgi:hypothetical protein